MYDRSFQWRNNIYFVSHLPPALHSSFYCSTNLTLNVTRSAMARAGWCPSGRLFEAAACGAPLLSDRWEGIDQFFSPGSEILLADTTEDAIAALEKSPGELARIAVAARERTLAENTAKIRVGQSEDIFSAALHSPAAAAMGDCA
jgi:spore maturation protein CgeB